MPLHSESQSAFLTIEQAAKLLRKGEISPLDLVDMSLAQTERLNPALNAFITILAGRARRQARAAGREIRRGNWRGPLHGIPISLKDNIWTRGVRTTAGSKVLSDFVPRVDAEVASRLAAAGAILLGKTNMHEFAYGVTNKNPHFGPTRNPWSHDRISGGSSGGSAAAVAAGLCFASAGTDTGGSIRIPSALCGIVGLKPTFGLVSLVGIVPLAESFDHAGPLTRSVADACIMLQAIAGKHPKGTVPPNYRRLRKDRPRKLRLGWPKQYFFERLDNEVRRAVEKAAECFESLDAHVKEVSLPKLADSIMPSTNIALAEATYYHESQGFYPARVKDYGEDVQERLEWGTKIRAVDYIQALSLRREVQRDFDKVFEHADAILAPTSPIAAPLLGEDEVTIGGETESVRSALLRLNRPANLTGHPAISIPCGFTEEGLPIGMQLIGPRWGESRLLAIALAYEEATEWHKRLPVLSTGI
jgi:aspartyl-tRNA(Asn)/glutamyl-tRNA(Gln) amidotransferase subunit A